MPTSVVIRKAKCRFASSASPVMTGGLTAATCMLSVVFNLAFLLFVFHGASTHGNIRAGTAARIRNEHADKCIDTSDEHALDGSPPPAEKWLLDGDAEPEYPPGARNGTAIPRIVHRVFLRASGGFVNLTESSPELRAAHASWPKRNPGYEMRYLDLEGCRRYLAAHFHPVFLRAFDCLQPFAYKADLFRYAWVYREGGWHVDWKMECLVENLFEGLARDGAHWVSAWDWGLPVARRNEYVQNSFFGALPRHPILAEVLEIVLKNIASRIYDSRDLAILCPTGPCALGDAVRRRNVTDTTAGTKWGIHAAGHYSFEGSRVLKTKCKGCVENWVRSHGGNDYTKMFEDHRTYCEDAPALLRSKSGEMGAVTDLL